MTIYNKNFENRISKNELKTINNPLMGEFFLLVRFLISIGLSYVIYLVNSKYDFTYTPMFILLLIGIIFLIHGGLLLGFSMRKINSHITDSEIKRLLTKSAKIQFIMSGIIIGTVAILGILYPIIITRPSFHHNFVGISEFFGLLLLVLLMLTELPCLSISFLLFGKALRIGNKKNYWEAKFPKSVIFLLVISSILLFTFILALIELIFPGSIYYFVSPFENPVMWREVLGIFFEYSLHFSPVIYGLMGLITMIDVIIQSRKIYQII